mmetsp:Transcript_56740/g.118641  ORF Transcript_56740/g.118641 Transcript_56740/m.118641 type:complete len:297 (+) Transcript_56740:707-1597(+)
MADGEVGHLRPFFLEKGTGVRQWKSKRAEEKNRTRSVKKWQQRRVRGRGRRQRSDGKGRYLQYHYHGVLDFGCCHHRTDARGFKQDLLFVEVAQFSRLERDAAWPTVWTVALENELDPLCEHARGRGVFRRGCRSGEHKCRSRLEGHVVVFVLRLQNFTFLDVHSTKNDIGAPIITFSGDRLESQCEELQITKLALQSDLGSYPGDIEWVCKKSINAARFFQGVQSQCANKLNPIYHIDGIWKQCQQGTARCHSQDIFTQRCQGSAIGQFEALRQIHFRNITISKRVSITTSHCFN